MQMFTSVLLQVIFFINLESLTEVWASTAVG